MSRLKSSGKKLYGGNRIYSPDGKYMFSCSDKRFHWYAERDLLEIRKPCPNGIGHLTFSPEGNGFSDNPELLVFKENKCVVCGTTEKLTRHHVVPKRYRKHLPYDMKANMEYDVFPLCVQCHTKYEESALDFDRELCDQYGLEIKGPRRPLGLTASAALYFAWNKLPPDIFEQKSKVFEEESGMETTRENVEDFYIREEQKYKERMNKFNSKKSLVENLPDKREFVLVWRRHFVDSMAPLFLPRGWKIDGPTSNRSRRTKGEKYHNA